MLAILMRVCYIIPRVQDYARELLGKYPDIAENLIKRWLNNREIYSNA